jgi:hypothetical protein
LRRSNRRVSDVQTTKNNIEIILERLNNILP